MSEIPANSILEVHDHWVLLKRPENLTEAQTVKLKELLRYNLKAVRAYLLREDFQRLKADRQKNSFLKD